jgi:hypothetical protein
MQPDSKCNRHATGSQLLGGDEVTMMGSTQSRRHRHLFAAVLKERRSCEIGGPECRHASEVIVVIDSSKPVVRRNIQACCRACGDAGPEQTKEDTE